MGDDDGLADVVAGGAPTGAEDAEEDQTGERGEHDAVAQYLLVQAPSGGHVMSDAGAASDDLPATEKEDTRNSELFVSAHLQRPDLMDR